MFTIRKNYTSTWWPQLSLVFKNTSSYAPWYYHAWKSVIIDSRNLSPISCLCQGSVSKHCHPSCQSSFIPDTGRISNTNLNWTNCLWFPPVLPPTGCRKRKMHEQRCNARRGGSSKWPIPRWQCCLGMLLNSVASTAAAAAAACDCE